MSSNSSCVSPAKGYGRELNENDFILVTEPIATIEDNPSTPDNLLGKDLQSVLKPINLMQAMFFCAKYKIRNNIISTNSAFYNIVSVFALFIVTCGCYYTTFGSTFSDDVNGFKYIQNLAKLYVFLVVLMSTLLNFCTNIIQKYNNVLFVMKIQAIYTNLKIKKSLNRFIFPNWISVIALNFYHIAWMLFSYFVIDFLGFGLTITNEVWLTLDMNILYAIRIMKLLTQPLKSWVKNAKMSECVYNSENERYWNTMLDVHMEILEAYKIFEKTVNKLILFYIIVTTSKSLISIAIRIEMKKVTAGSDVNFAVLSFISLTWIIKNMFLIIFLSVDNERFFSTMGEVERACIQLANSSRCSDTQKRVCKNIQRVQKTSFKKMHACGLFIIDASLSLHLCALITSYTVVILQFEFL